MQIDLTQIQIAILTLIFGILSRYLIPVAKEKLNADQMELVRIAVKTAVSAAEQLYGSGQGQRKKEYVINRLAEDGYIVDPAQVEAKMDMLIEAMVHELNVEQAKK